MKTFSLLFGLRLCLGPALCVFAASVAGAALESNLVEHSPFLPPGWGKQVDAPVVKEEAPVVQGPLSRELEFRGIFAMGDTLKFSIFDKSTQQGQWIPLNGGTDRFSIVRYNSDKNSIMVKSGSRMEELSLAEADDKPLVVSGLSAPNFTPPTPPPNFTPPTSPPTSPPSTSPPNFTPPPPPAALLNARNNAAGATVPRRRIIRRTSDGADSGGGTTGTSSGSSTSNNYNLPANIPPPPSTIPTGAPTSPPSSSPPSSQ